MNTPATPFRRVGIGTADISPTDEARVVAVLRSGRLSAGPMTHAFETAIAGLAGRRHANFLNSGTGALQMALQALKEQRGWPDGAEVLVPATTFVASVNTILYAGLTPRLVDVDPGTYTIDPTATEAAITPHTVAIMAVAIAGLPADLVALAGIAERHDLALIEDSAEAIGVRRDGLPTGGAGIVGCYSTYMAHILTTGVGGLAVTDDEDLHTRIRSLMNHGRDPIYLRIDDDEHVDDARLRAIVAGRYRFVSRGQSFRVTEMEAALGIGQVERLAANLAARRAIACELHAVFVARGLTPQVVPAGADHAYMFFAATAPDRATRERVLLALERAGVETRELLPILGQPCYADLDFDPARTPVAADLIERAFYVGCHQGMSAIDVAHIAAALDQAGLRA